jgi:hypothetical protein
MNPKVYCSECKHFVTLVKYTGEDIEYCKKAGQMLYDGNYRDRPSYKEPLPKIKNANNDCQDFEEVD